MTRSEAWVMFAAGAIARGDADADAEGAVLDADYLIEKYDERFPASEPEERTYLTINGDDDYPSFELDVTDIGVGQFSWLCKKLFGEDVEQHPVDADLTDAEIPR